MSKEKVLALARKCDIIPYLVGESGVYFNMIEKFYHAAIEDFLKESGQCLTNDITSEACIKQAKDEA